MSCSRVIIEQRLADLELALKRQEELISSQRDAIRNLRDLIALDQNYSSNSMDVVNNSMNVPHLNNGHLYSNSNNNASFTSLSAPMSLPRPNNQNNILHPHDTNSPAALAPAPLIASNTNSFLGQRGYPSFIVDASVQYDQHQSIPDVSSTSLLAQGTPANVGKRARSEFETNTTITTTTSCTHVNQISRNTVVSAPVAPPLKRRRALEKIRQLSSLFPLVQSFGPGTNISATSLSTTSISPPPPPAPPVAAWRKPIISGPNAQASFFSNSEPPPNTASAIQRPAQKGVTNNKGNTISRTEPPVHLPVAQPGIAVAVNSQDMRSTALTQAVTNAGKPGRVVASNETPTGNSFNISTVVTSNTTNSRSSISNNNLPAADHAKSSIAFTIADPVIYLTVTKDIPIMNLIENSNDGKSNFAEIGTASDATTALASSTNTATADAPSVAAHAMSSNAAVVSSATLTNNTSASNDSLNENNNHNGIKSMDNSVHLKSSSQSVHKQSNPWLAQMNLLNSATLRAKADFLVSLPRKLEIDGATLDMKQWLIDGGKRQCFYWLHRLEEDYSELPIDGISLLEAILNALVTQASYSKEEVMETRIDKLLRRIYKKYSVQKLSLGQQLLDTIRLLWAEYRALYKEAAGDNDAD